MREITNMKKTFNDHPYVQWTTIKFQYLRVKFIKYGKNDKQMRHHKFQASSKIYKQALALKTNLNQIKRIISHQESVIITNIELHC